MKPIKKINFRCILIFISCLFLLSFLLIYVNKHERLNLNYINTVNASVHWDIDDNWFIITSKEQRDSWIEEGMDLPDINFEANFLIVSKVKIDRLYKSRIINHDFGSYDGIILYNPLSQSENKYYLYEMDKVMLSQAIG